MRKLILVVIFLLPIFYLKAQEVSPADAKAESIISQLTLEEKISLIGGKRLFYTNGIPEKGINPVLFSDATQGIALRPAPIYKGWKLPLKLTLAYPAPILLAATWDTELTYRYAEAVGEECRAAGIGVLLGPGFNMYRISQCGRNFEYFGEDPFLVSSLIGSYVKGVQSTGTIATLKHFVANNSDFYRRKSNTIVDERALNEIYLPPYRAGIEAGAGAVMTAYNLLDGEWCGQSDHVINDILRGQLGFQGLVMTDWWSVNDGKKLIRSGQDLEMPARKATKDVLKWVEDGSIPEEEIDRMVQSQVSTFLKWGSYDLQASEMSGTMIQRHEELARETAQKGMVLLKNERRLLPINTKDQKQILVTGPFADKNAYGTGAARVKGYDHITIKDALLSSDLKDLKFSRNPDEDDIKNAELIIVCTGTIDGEGSDRPFELPSEQEELISKCVRKNPNTVVVLTTGSGVRMTDWNEKAGAILYAWYYGQNGAAALVDILTGKVNPSGKLPITIEKDFKDSPGFAYLPPGEELYDGFQSGKERKREVFEVVYKEGIFTGYRWYDHREIEPLYPFGHGLSYTDFTYRDIEAGQNVYGPNDTIALTALLENTGEVDGVEVVQVYVSCTHSMVERPIQELKAFQKQTLKKGEERQVEFEIPVKDLAYWSNEQHQWIVEPGNYELRIGASSRDLSLNTKIQIQSSPE